jgi:hypothetical protein
MSTKIYNGTCLPAMSMTALLKFLKSIQPEFKAKMQKRIDTMNIRVSTFEYDNRTLGLSTETDSISSFFDDYLRDLVKKGYFTPQSEIAIFPLKNKILTIFYGERDMEKIWSENKKVKPYGYWDNTDREEGISSKEWAQRKKDWDKVLLNDDLTGVPSLDGFGFNFTNNDTFYYLWWESAKEREQRLMKHLPSMEERVKHCAEIMVDKEAKVTIQDAMPYLLSEDRKQKIAAKMLEIQGKLEDIKEVATIYRKEWKKNEVL